MLEVRDGRCCTRLGRLDVGTPLDGRRFELVAQGSDRFLQLQIHSAQRRQG
jgi:hypothetical protein